MNIVPYLPNLFTALRMLCAMALFALSPTSGAFWALYLFCGVSDALDGFLARKLQASSLFGAAFDSVADLVFLLVCLWIFVPRISWEIWMVVWLTAIFLLRLAAFCIGLARWKAPLLCHTYSNKLAGAGLFFFPLIFVCQPLAAWLVTGVLASLAALDELLLMLGTRRPTRDDLGLLGTKRPKGNAPGPQQQ